MTVGFETELVSAGMLVQFTSTYTGHSLQAQCQITYWKVTEGLILWEKNLNELRDCVNNFVGYMDWDSCYLAATT